MRSLAIALLLTPIALGEVREVPAQYATIQAAVDAAVNGDIVRVAPGQYVGALTMRGKALEIRSWDPGDPNTVRSTVLSNDTGSVILLDTTNGFTRLRGLTIMGDHLDGSGVDIARNSNAEIDGCRFLQNYTEGVGAAIRTDGNMTVIIRDSLFDSNRASGGAAIHFFAGRARIVNSVFVRNKATGPGGAIKNFVSLCHLSGCVFVGNNGLLGAVNHTGSDGAVFCANSVFVMNTTTMKFGFGNALASASDPIRVTARNCVLARNGPAITNRQVLRVDMAHSLIIQPELTGPGLIAEEPDFVRWPSDGGDGWGDDPNTPEDEGANDDFGDLRLLPGSPGIDAGDNRAILPDFADLDDDGDANEPTPVDFDGNPRIADDPNSPDLGIGPWAVVDMGAYEFVSATSLCREDVTGDGDVGLDDLSALLAAYASNAGDPEYQAAIDVTDDGAIDLRDLAAILSVFGENCPN